MKYHTIGFIKPYLEMDLSISSLAEDKIWVGIKIAAWMNASYYKTPALSQKKLFVSIIFEIGFASFNRISFCPKVFSIHFEATTKSMKWENFFKFIYCKAGNLRSIGTVCSQTVKVH